MFHSDLNEFSDTSNEFRSSVTDLNTRKANVGDDIEDHHEEPIFSRRPNSSRQKRDDQLPSRPSRSSTTTAMSVILDRFNDYEQVDFDFFLESNTFIIVFLFILDCHSDCQKAFDRS